MKPSHSSSKSRPLSPRGAWTLAPSGLLPLLLVACGRQPEGGPAPPPGQVSAPDPLPSTARWETYRTLREDLDTPRHPSDGGGRGWLVSEDHQAFVVDTAVSLNLVYEAGEAGIADGGALYFMSSPYWGWDSPQVRDPEGPGFTRVQTKAPGLHLEPEALAPHLLSIRVGGRALQPGERIEVKFGAGARGARIDRFAGPERLWFAVDGNGDGVRAIVVESPQITIGPGPPAMLGAVATSRARPEEELQLTLAVLDKYANAATDFTGAVTLRADRAGLELPRTVAFLPEHRGHRTVVVPAGQPGLYRVYAESVGSEHELSATFNPIEVSEERPAVLWADLHGHSGLSDGSADPREWFHYAREVAGLDVAALTDHDHWGIRMLDSTPEYQERVSEAVTDSHAPGSFVALHGFEWTNWIHGHRHVVGFGSELPILSSLDPAYDDPAELWDALRGKQAITIAHHSAGGPVALNWTYAPPPDIEPVTEVTSVHGSSEAPDSPSRIYGWRPGNSVRSALTRGYQLGFVGSGDGHDGHPGLSHLVPDYRPKGGLAALVGADLTRKGVQSALLERRTYATSGPRILMHFGLDGHAPGAVVGEEEIGVPSFELEVHGTAPIRYVTWVRSGEELAQVEVGDRLSYRETRSIPNLKAGEFVYVRVVQADRGLAFGSPIFIE